MLGQHKREEKKLREHGAQAIAEVVKATRGKMTVSTGNPQLVDNTQVIWRLALRVRPRSGEEFTAQIKQRFSQMDSPVAGMVIPVLYDPDDHSKLVIDHNDAATVNAASTLAKSRVNQMLAGDPARPAQIGNMIDTVMGDPKEMAAQFRKDPKAAIAASQERARAAAAVAGLPAAGAQPPSEAIAPAAADPADQLTKLADLRDRGLLTDEEFQAQKRRVLGR